MQIEVIPVVVGMYPVKMVSHVGVNSLHI